jgi:hypothetical protein
MPRQCILTAAERSALSAFPIEKSELIRLYTFSEHRQALAVVMTGGYCRGLHVASRWA